MAYNVLQLGNGVVRKKSNCLQKLKVSAKSRKCDFPHYNAILIMHVITITLETKL